MLSDSLSPQHVVAYMCFHAFSVRLATLKMMISHIKVVRIRLCTSRSIIWSILKCAEHGLHGGVIICFVYPWVYEILRQMFKGGGGAYFLCCVYMYSNAEDLTCETRQIYEHKTYNLSII